MICENCLYNKNCQFLLKHRNGEMVLCTTFEDKSEWVHLPCKVGDTVYKLWYKPCHNGEEAPDSYGCCGCEDECDLKRDIFEYVVPSVDWILRRKNSFGKGVWYLTREEAEDAMDGK